MNAHFNMNRNHRFIIKYCIILFVLLVCHSCSWVEDFVISNETEQTILVSYELNEAKSSFPIFESKPDLYQMNSLQEVDWNKQRISEDADTAVRKVSIQVPPNCALVFGRLQNDTYKRYDQYFINGRTFNLKNLKISVANKTTDILPETFDKYFKKHNGSITYSVR